MIRLVEGSQDQKEFFHLCGESAFGCKLAASAGAYGFELPFARFWLGQGCALGMLDGAMVLAGLPENWGELQAFLRSLGPGILCCREEFAPLLGLEIGNRGMVLGKNLPGEPADPGGSVGEPPKLEEIYGLLLRCEMAGDWEPFYLDLSHRLRHGGALALGEHRQGRLAGCAVILMAEGQAVLSALAVEEEFRGQGLGTRLVARTESALAGRKLYVLRESGRNQRFYQRLGYREVDRWAEGKRIF